MKIYIFRPSAKGRDLFPVLTQKGYLWDGLDHLIRFLDINPDDYDFATQSVETGKWESREHIMARGIGIPKEMEDPNSYCHIGTLLELKGGQCKKSGWVPRNTPPRS